MKKTPPARSGPGLKALLAAVLVAPVGIGLAMLPSGAAEEPDAGHDHADHAHPAMTADLQRQLARVRAATAPFHDVDAAVAAGYELGWVNGAGTRIVAGCVAHPAGAGAMGYHYFNADLMRDDSTDALRPEVLVYAPTPDGGRELVAVEWVVRGPQSNPPGPSRVPSVLGMDMHVLAPPPGPAFYLTHAWIWAPNPDGMFADWNPRVSCA